MQFIWDILILLVLSYLAWLGSAKGIYLTSLAAVQLFFSLALAILLHEPLAGLLAGFMQENLGMFLPDTVSYSAWAVFISFSVLMWGTFLLSWLFLNPKASVEQTATIPAVDMAGGAGMGLVAGILAMGAGMVTWSMCPFLGGLRIPAQHLFVDVGKTALRTAGSFAGERHEGRSLVLYGEPASRESVGSARLATETWFDTDANTTQDDHDPYYDVDGNGTFTKDLYYEDVDGNRRRRVGLIEKYTVGRWDAQLMVADRERPKREGPKGPGGQSATAPKVPPSAPAPAAPPEQPAPAEVEEGATKKPPKPETVDPTEPSDDF